MPVQKLKSKKFVKNARSAGTLKASHLGAGYRGSTALYALPWYMIIGPSAVEKAHSCKFRLHFLIPTPTSSIFKALPETAIGGLVNKPY